MPQEPLLFHRSIAENIAYGRLDADPVEIELAASRANVTQFVAGLLLDEGRIAETGSHHELLADSGGICASFWARQSGGAVVGEQLTRG